MTPPLCESDFNTGADLSPREPQSGLSSETGPLISDQTTVLVSNNPSLKASADPDGRVGGTGGTFLKKRDRCGIDADPRTSRVCLVNYIDHVTGFTDEDLAELFHGYPARVTQHLSPLSNFNLRVSPSRCWNSASGPRRP